MKDLIFWSKWTTPTKILYWLSLSLFFASISYFVVYYFWGLDALLEWQVESDIRNVTNTLEVFRHKLFDVPVDSENFVVLQYFKSSLFKINYLSANIFLGLTVFAACLGITVVTTYKKILWFIPGSALFTAWLASFKLDLLGVFGQNDNTLLAIMLVVYLGLSYVFHSWYTKITFLKRFLAFFGVTVIFGIIISQFSTVSNPFMYMANFGLVVPAIITLGFILIIGYEIIYLLLTVLTSTKSADPRFIPINFFVLTGLYVGNIIVYYLYLEGEITWSFPFNVYLFYPICGVLGIWSHRKRSVLYTNILPYAPGGAFLYLVFGIVSFATIGYLLSLSMTSGIKVFEFIFFVSQISFGIVFFAYVIRHFFREMINNMPVHKMVFDSKQMMHWSLRLAAMVVMMYFIGKRSDLLGNDLQATYFNLKADAYRGDGQDIVAIKNYELSLDKHEGGHHACFSMGSIYFGQNDFGQATNALNAVSINETSEYLYASLSAAYKGNNQTLKDLLILKDGVKRFPNSPHLANNLGLAYYQIDYQDSALYFMNKAIESEEKEVVNSNYIGVAALNKLGDPEQALQIDEDLVDSKIYMTNVYALANALNTQPTKQYDVTKLDDQVGGIELSLVNNYIDNNIYDVPKELNEKLQYWVDSVIYNSNLDNARFTLGKSYFYNDEVAKGLSLLSYLTKHATKYQFSHFSNFTGLMQMKAGLSMPSYENLVNADQSMQLSKQNFARENAAIASLEVFDTSYAVALYDYLARYDATKRAEYNVIVESIEGNHDSTDFHKALFLVFDPAAKKENPFPILASFTNQTLKGMTIVNLLEKALDDDKQSILVEKLWEVMPQSIEDKELFFATNLLNLKTHLVFRDYEALEKDLNQLELNDFDQRWKTFFETKLAEHNEDHEFVVDGYKECMKLFPNNDYVWGDAVDYFVSQDDIEQSYDLCTNYLQKYGSTKRMLKTYVDLALENSLFSFALDGVKELEGFMTEDEYEVYFNSYKEVLGLEENEDEDIY